MIIFAIHTTKITHQIECIAQQGAEVVQQFRQCRHPLFVLGHVPQSIMNMI